MLCVCVQAIVAGALHIVRDTLREFPTMSEATKEKVVSNMLVTLTSHAAPTPTIPMV